jgi:hypothetical protein
MAAISAPVREFLTWVARCPRTYADAMEAWRSSCPRYTVWEDALADGLIHVAPVGGGVAEPQVTLTVRGQAVLAGVRARTDVVCDGPRDAEARGQTLERDLVTVADRPG